MSQALRGTGGGRWFRYTLGRRGEAYVNLDWVIGVEVFRGASGQETLDIRMAEGPPLHLTDERDRARLLALLRAGGVEGALDA